ncbi:MAG TPA: acetyl-CoA acetyltransferase [Dehalococcoidia bacterium]|nr:acetyl-CoA acetyltransferase [Dehalococcoidia bacterium]
MSGIRDRVAIIGAGCTKFGEMWEKDAEDLLVDAAFDAIEDAGLAPKDIQAAWVGAAFQQLTGMSGTIVTDTLKIWGIPVTRVENRCATGMDAFRNACYAVAAGIYDVVLACGVEKLLDQGGHGLRREEPHPIFAGVSAAGLFSMAANRSMMAYNWSKEDLARVAVKNHKNGIQHPKAHFRRAVTIEEVISAPMIAYPLGRLDCCAVSDGSAAVVLTRPEIARQTRHKDDYVLVKAATLSVYSGQPWFRNDFDFTYFPATRRAAQTAYEEAGIRDPVQEIDLVECHDCFTITELLNMQDLGFCQRGEAARLVAEGWSDAEGEVPFNPSGGLKCFGHPIGATGCRVVYELTRQLQGRADGYQVKDAKLALGHTLGGPGALASVVILGRQDV